MTDDEAMSLALAQANLALEKGDVPVGAIVLLDGEVIGQGHNVREANQDPLGHAEMVAISQAARHLGSWRLGGTTLVVTLEPCVMCAGAIVAARVGGVVFGAFDPKAGAAGSLYNVCSDPRLNHEALVKGGVRAVECGELLKKFFAAQRQAPTEL